MRFSHKRKITQKKSKMICGIPNWDRQVYKPGPWIEGHYEASVELKPAPNIGYYSECRTTRKIYRQGFFFGKKYAVGAG